MEKKADSNVLFRRICWGVILSRGGGGFVFTGDNFQRDGLPKM